MAKCDGCGRTIFIGAIKDGALRYCNKTCKQEAPFTKYAADLPMAEVQAEMNKLHGGLCPKCNGVGPVDIHTAHTIFSVVYVTSWNSKPHLCCRACGRKEQAKALAMATFLGWWGLPWGLLFTPVQIGKNIAGMIGGPKPEQPSAELEKIVRGMLTHNHFVEQSTVAAPLASQSMPLSTPIPEVPLPRAAAAQQQQTTQNSPFSDSKPFD